MPKPLRILTIEDSEDDALLVAREFRKGGVEALFTRVETRESLCAALQGGLWDIVLCDYSMPHFSGMEALELIRELAGDIPVIIVSGTIGEDVAVEAMRAGANDYFMKDKLQRLVPAVERELRDATVRFERKRAEEALRQATEEIRDLYNHAPCGYHSLDQNGVIVRINDTELEWLNYTREEMLGKMKFEELLTAEGQRAFQTSFPCLKATGTVRDLEFELTRKNGTVFPALVSATALMDRDGNYVMSRSTVYDLTERKRVEETLRKLSHAVEQSPASIVITNTRGDIEYVNRKFTALTGYLSDEVLGRNPRLLKSGETPVEEYRRLWETVLSGREWRGVFHNRKKSGELYWERASISPIFNPAGAISHLVAMKEDITEHKRLEEEFRQAQKLEAVGQLAGGVAHDFNNILAAILMNLCLLKDTPGLDPQIVTGLQELEHEATRAASLTRQLLLFSRRQAIDAKPLDLNDVVNGMTKMLRRLIGEDIELVFQGQSVGMWVMADAGMMDQVLMNLCINARDAMPQGGRLTIGTRRVVLDEESVRGKPEACAGVHVCLSVSDTGTGMDSQTLKHIYEPFFTTKEAGKGTGLGLATVYGIVTQHRGWITVETELQKGTTFQIYLPALLEATIRQVAAVESNLRGGTETVLLAEDDQYLRRFTALNLRKLGYAVLEASCVREALGLWEQNRSRIDLLFADVVMPGGGSGVELAEQLVKEKPALRVVLTSGYPAERAKPGLLAGKGIVFVAKPYDGLQIARVVRSCLDRSSSGGANP